MMDLVGLTKSRLHKMRSEWDTFLDTSSMDSNKMKEKVANMTGEARERLLQWHLQRSCLDPQGNPEEFAKLRDFVALLAGHDTITLNMTPMFSFLPKSLQAGALDQVISMLVERAPNIEDLTADAKCGPGTLAKLAGLKNLKKLRLEDLDADLKALVGVSAKLPELRILRINFGVERGGGEDVSEAELLAGMGHLRVFEHNMTSLVPRKIYDFADAQLPALDHLDFTDMAPFRWEDCPIPLGGPRYRPARTGRRHLFHAFEQCIFFKQQDPQYHLKYPNITHLHVDALDFPVETTLCKQLEMSLFKLIKVEALCVEAPSSQEMLDCFLASKFGPGLRMLIILGEDFDEDGLSFKKICQLCPQLEHLTIMNYPMNDAAEPIPNLDHLKVLKWIKTWRFDGVMELSNILIAPKLRKVELKGTYSVADLQNLTTRIASGQILTHLQSLKICIYYADSIDDEAVDLALFRAVSALLKTAAAHLEELSYLKLTYFGDSFEHVSLVRGYQCFDTFVGPFQAKLEEVKEYLMDVDLIAILDEFNDFNGVFAPMA